MTIAFSALPERPEVMPSRAVAVRISSARGLNVQISGYCQFDLNKTPIADVVAMIAKSGFAWPAPTFGPMKTALSIGIEAPLCIVFFVLDRSLSAEFSTSLPPFFAADDDSKMFLCNPTLWSTGQDGATIASITAAFDGKPRIVSFNMAVDNVGVVGCTSEPYRTPFIIDPDLRYPPPGGAGGPQP